MSRIGTTTPDNRLLPLQHSDLVSSSFTYLICGRGPVSGVTRDRAASILFWLEVELQTELDLSRAVALRIHDITEGGTVHVGGRPRQPVPIEGVKRRGPELEVATFTQVEALQNGDVLVDRFRAAKLGNSDRRVAVLHVRRTDEGRLVKVRDAQGNFRAGVPIGVD